MGGMRLIEFASPQHCCGALFWTFFGFMHYARRRCLLRRVVHLVSVISPCASPLFPVGHPCTFAYVFPDFSPLSFQ